MLPEYLLGRALTGAAGTGQQQRALRRFGDRDRRGIRISRRIEELLGGQRFDDKTSLGLAGKQHSDVEAAIDQPFAQKRTVAVGEIQQDLRVRLSHAREQLIADEWRPGDWKSDRHPARGLVERACRIEFGLFDVTEDRLGMAIKDAACVGEQDALRTARDWLLELELPGLGKMMTDRRLCDMQLVRGARQAARLHDPDEITKLAQIHAQLSVARAPFCSRFCRPAQRSRRAARVTEERRPARELNEPFGAAVDSAGDIYIDDGYNQQIRVVYQGGAVVAGLIRLENPGVTPVVGDIYTIAGDGTSGYNGDGILATSAELSTPFGVATDSAGNVYIADDFNERVRKVSASTGDISTFAGNGNYGFAGDTGAAISAELWAPCAVAVDSAGNIYIADVFNGRVRVVGAP